MTRAHYAVISMDGLAQAAAAHRPVEDDQSKRSRRGQTAAVAARVVACHAVHVAEQRAHVRACRWLLQLTAASCSRRSCAGRRPGHGVTLKAQLGLDHVELSGKCDRSTVGAASGHRTTVGDLQRHAVGGVQLRLQSWDPMSPHPVCAVVCSVRVCAHATRGPSGVRNFEYSSFQVE